MTRLMLIINPAAGRGGFRNGLGDALNLLDKGGCRTTLFFTSGRGDATEFAAKYGADFDIVGCVGGDGTLSEVLAGLMRLENPPMVGYIPMGTANDVATTLGLPKNDTVSAARRILNGEPHPFDVGGFGYDKYFAYIAAFGAFTEVSYATPQSRKSCWGIWPTSFRAWPRCRSWRATTPASSTTMAYSRGGSCTAACRIQLRSRA